MIIHQLIGRAAKLQGHIPEFVLGVRRARPGALQANPPDGLCRKPVAQTVEQAMHLDEETVADEMHQLGIVPETVGKGRIVHDEGRVSGAHPHGVVRCAVHHVEMLGEAHHRVLKRARLLRLGDDEIAGLVGQRALGQSRRQVVQRLGNVALDSVIILQLQPPLRVCCAHALHETQPRQNPLDVDAAFSRRHENRPDLGEEDTGRAKTHIVSPLLPFLMDCNATFWFRTLNVPEYGVQPNRYGVPCQFTAQERSENGPPATRKATFGKQ